MGTVRGVIYLRILVVSIMGILVFPVLWENNQYSSLQERTKIIERPAQLWDGLIKHEWQPFLEQRFLLGHIGRLRSYLVRSYNETIYQLFPTRPNAHYIWTPEQGYYPVNTIRRINYDVLHRDDLKQHYQQAARRLRILQEILGHHGVTLLVVIPPPKVRVYPEYVSPYLIAPPENIMSQAVSYGDALENNGVNVLNVRRTFLENKTTSPWPYFSTTGFHWNYWAACTVTDEIMRKTDAVTGRSSFSIGCSDVEKAKSKWADTDIAAILNIHSTDAIIGQSPFPKIIPQKIFEGEGRKIVMIGDSYSDHLIYALTQALPEMSWSPGWLTRYDYFVSRQTFGISGKVTAQTPLQQDAVLSEILSKDLLVIEMSDGNISRDDLNSMEYGATRTLLDGLLQGRMVDPRNYLTSGWRHNLDKKQWNTTGAIASFAIRPPTDGNTTQLAIDIENLATNRYKPRLLDILLDGKRISQSTLAHGREVLTLTLPNSAPLHDSLVAEISLRDAFGQPLDILLHGIQITGAGKGKAVITTEALPSSPILTHSDIKSINLISNEEPEDILVEGLSGLESNDKESWRWAIGPATRIKFYVGPSQPNQARQHLLKFSFKNGASIPEQAVTIRLNGKDVRYFSPKEIAMHEKTEADVTLKPRKGVNVLEIVYKDWNHGKKVYAAHDSRQLAVVVMRLSLQEASK